MSNERKLSETMQELKTLRLEKESCITGVKIGMNSGDWFHVSRCVNRIIQIEELSLNKNLAAKSLVIEIDKEREKDILEVIA